MIKYGLLKLHKCLKNRILDRHLVTCWNFTSA